MKRIKGTKKIVLFVALCVAFVIPAVASAEELLNEEFTPGVYTRQIEMDAGALSLSYEVINGGGSGKDFISSVLVTDADNNIFTPDQFNQHVSNEFKELTNVQGKELVDLTIRVKGKKSGAIQLIVTAEYPESNDPMDYWKNGGF